MWKIKVETNRKLSYDLEQYGFFYNQFLDMWEDRAGWPDPITRIYKVVEYLKSDKKDITKFYVLKAEHVSDLLPCFKGP